jgi:hypothetical protein
MMRRDAMQGFTTQKDADRFYDLVMRRDASLFEGNERAPASADSAAVLQALDEEAARIGAMAPSGKF